MREIADFEIDIISDILANFHDWPAEDLLAELDRNLKENEIELTEEAVRQLFKEFSSIDIKLRTSPYFNHLEFVRSISKIL